MTIPETHKNSTFGLPELLAIARPTDFVIDGHSFEGCQFHGPAVLALISNVKFGDNHINGNLDAVLWELAPNRGQIIGAFGLSDCEILQCTFTNIGFAAVPAVIASFRAESHSA